MCVALEYIENTPSLNNPLSFGSVGSVTVNVVLIYPTCGLYPLYTTRYTPKSPNTGSIFGSKPWWPLYTNS